MNDISRHAQLFALLNTEIIEDEGQNTFSAPVTRRVELTDEITDAFLQRAQTSWGEPVELPFVAQPSRETR